MNDRYTYRITWSPEDEEYVGLCVEFPSLSWLDDTQAKAFDGIQRMVAEVVEDMRANNEPVPEPMAERRYSGKFMVRIPPELHQNLAIQAAEAGVSLNRLVSARLANNPAISVQRPKATDLASRIGSFIDPEDWRTGIEQIADALNYPSALPDANPQNPIRIHPPEVSASSPGGPRTGFERPAAYDPNGELMRSLSSALEKAALQDYYGAREELKFAITMDSDFSPAHLLQAVIQRLERGNSAGVMNLSTESLPAAENPLG